MLRHFTFLLVIFTLLSPSLAAPPAPPNILFILIDDMGWRDLTCTGSTFYETPNIDRLAHQGLLFTSAYAACPVCSPSRASILTGQYPARVGLTDYLGGKSTGRLLPAPYLQHLPLTLPNTAKSLHSIGYQTWHVGKWHLGPEPFWPEHQGFDVNIGGFDAGHPSSYFSPYKNPRLPDGPPGEFLTDRLTDEAIKLIKNRDPGRPFYLNLCQYAVH
ncbi:MAG TPA: sulfatase-like hydrolase/transferase, partial [Tepidisphaeraceae bacterium]|nr:sulfatase-like hydrolase/transferase [Tepidisphaeraceae bacterium]